MIRLILGQPGSGKSLSAVKRLIDSKERSFTNFRLRREGIERIKMEDVLNRSDPEKGESKFVSVNWEFWKRQIEKYEGFHIYIDELHNVLNARLSMSKKNVLLTQWVAQIRKVTGENEVYDFVCISQELERVDIAVRDLTYEIIACVKKQDRVMIPTVVYERGRKKEKMIPRTWILQHYFKGQGCTNRYKAWRDTRVKAYNYRTYFYANPYMKFYDSYELIDFGNEVYL